MTNHIPAIDILGVGPIGAERLGERGVFTVSDLLWAPRSLLVEVTKSERIARSWRSMAVLMQIEGVTPHHARALVEAGIDKLEEMGTRKVSQVAEALRDADGEPLDGVDTDSIGRMIADAVRIHCSPFLSLELLGEGDAPAVGYSVRVGRVEETSDERGRVRLTRLASDPAPRIWLEHPDHGARFLDGLTPLADPDVCALVRVRLSSCKAAPDLSEFDGDILPIRGHERSTEETRAEDELRDGDLLRVIAFRKSGQALLASMFRDYRGGRIVAIRFRVARAKLPAGTELHDYLTYRDQQFRPWRMTPARVTKYRRAHPIRHLLPAADASPEERSRAIEAWVAKAIEIGVFSRKS